MCVCAGKDGHLLLPVALKGFIKKKNKKKKVEKSTDYMARALKVFFFSFSDVYMTHDIPVTKPTSDCCRIKKKCSWIKLRERKKEARRQKKEEERKFRSS